MQKSLINLLLAALISLVASCGGGGGGSNSSAPDNSNNQNTAPSISGSITKIRVGANLDFYPSAYDAENDNLTFSISLPDGCGFIYNNASLDSENTGCDYRDISIKKFVEMRRETLY